MLLTRNIFSLPTSLLLFLFPNPPSAHSVEVVQPQEPEWPHNLPPHLKYWPEDRSHRHRGLEVAQEHIYAGHSPVGVKKMSESEDEMFFPEYWSFQEGHIEERMLGNWIDTPESKSIEDDNSLLINITATVPFQAPFAIHASGGSLNTRDLEAQAKDSSIALQLLRKRDFTCPTGTFSCTSINQPNYCCATGSSCFNITDTGLGPVGCCASGSSCSGDITSCASGNTACPQNLGGACCIPGFTCAGIGCVSNVVVTIFSTVTQVASTSSTLSVSTTIVPVTTITSTDITSSTAEPPPTDTAIQTTLACPTSYTACPINMGGGCCLSGRICTTGLICPLPTTVIIGTGTSSATASAPVRGTSVSDSSSLTTPVLTGSLCPTGFYACSAYLPAGGCCRIGRDCATTNCPATASTTLVSSGQTIVVPLVPSATTTAPAGCASGWAACPASIGGACCPSGWQCGTASCTSVAATTTATVGKEAAALNDGRRAVGEVRAATLMLVLIWVILS